MMQASNVDLERFYELLGQLACLPHQGRPLSGLPRPSLLPHRGVYFFMEPGEARAANPSVQRVVRVGTHAVSSGSKSTLHGRLKQHLGTRSGGGSHRGSIFRRHVGDALQKRDGLQLPMWGVGSSAPSAVRDDEATRAAEMECENCVSAYIGTMPVLWIDVPDDASPQSDRAFIERNVIALLSNQFAPVDFASANWLGAFSPRQEIRESAPWNLNYVSDAYDPKFVGTFESYVTATCLRTAVS